MTNWWSGSVPEIEFSLECSVSSLRLEPPPPGGGRIQQILVIPA